MNVTQIFISCDSAAVALGADVIVEKINAESKSRGIDVKVNRNSTRGMFWLEPLVEVQTSSGRVAYGPIQSADVSDLFDCGFLEGHSHIKYLGLTEQIPYLAKQQRLTFSRMGVTKPLSILDYKSHGGFLGLKKALQNGAEFILKELLDSGLRGRGGAAFPAGVKWKTVQQTEGEQKFVVCNADEGDSGTYSDRMTMEGDPYMLIEGMVIAGLAVHATRGYIYIRSEYLQAITVMQKALQLATESGFLGENILDSGKSFFIEIRKAAGSYVCGEETAMLESIEGKRGVVRAKPPLPAIRGLFGCPTVINNVITLASVPLIIANGADYYKNFGMGRSKGTLPFQLAGNVKYAGLVETAFGLSLRQLIYDFGGGSRSGRPIKAVQVGGPLGAYIPESQWDAPLEYETYAAMGAVLGHGGIVVHDDTVDMSKMARYAMEFCSIESCGKCTPCRIGSTRGVEVIDRIINNQERDQQIELLRDLCNTMVNGSLCAMGSMTPYPVLSALNHYSADFTSD